MFTFTTMSHKLVRVDQDGQFAGWLDRKYRKPTGLNAVAYYVWSGTIAGVSIRATSLRLAKAKVVAIAGRA